MKLEVFGLVLLFATVGFCEMLSEETEKQGVVGWSELSGDETTSVPSQDAGKRRRRRMSCEVLSFPLPYGYMNHAACASYCFVTGMNFRGHCEFGWCKCK